jgi:hypothetical protein
MSLAPKCDRGVTAGISIIFMVAVVVVLGATLTVAFGQTVDSVQNPPPTGTFEHQKSERGADKDQLKLTLTGGEALEAKRLLIVATEPVDLGRPGHFCDSCATTGEKLTEGDDQVRIGDTWEAGESIHLRGTGTGELEGVTIRLVWNPVEVDKDDANGREPSEIVGENSHVLLKFTVE